MEPVEETCRNDVFAGFLMLLLGMLMIVWPARIQQLQIRWQERHPKLAGLNPLADWNRSAATLLIRLAGFMPIGLVLLRSFSLLRTAPNDLFSNYASVTGDRRENFVAQGHH
jgi:hypothetical protein